MDHDVRGEIMDIDLNQEPLDPQHGSMHELGSLLSDIDTTHERIEERIRQLEAVTTRARQRQRWRQGQETSQAVNILREHVAANVHVDFVVQQITVENGKFSKRDSTHLIAKALRMDIDANKALSDTEGFYDCNICLAREPILTCCGHLFCWSCFYRLSYTHSNVKECPVCKGDVLDTSITPIYGNGSDNYDHVSKSQDSGLEVPPRPRAHRIESVSSK
ncbi:zf-C3HC4_2 domain-containing protein, partial [Cephalotus follicularis]